MSISKLNMTFSTSFFFQLKNALFIHSFIHVPLWYTVLNNKSSPMIDFGNLLSRIFIEEGSNEMSASTYNKRA
jgi:hypothetical protein